MDYNFSERRKQPRIYVEWAIYVEIVERGSRTEADNIIIRCETVDVSASGLRIWMPQAIAQGSTLNLAVPMEEWTENLELVGKVMWSTEAENREGYWVGLELDDASPEDMRKWFDVVQALKS